MQTSSKPGTQKIKEPKKHCPISKHNVTQLCWSYKLYKTKFSLFHKPYIEEKLLKFFLIFALFDERNYAAILKTCYYKWVSIDWTHIVELSALRLLQAICYNICILKLASYVLSYSKLYSYNRWSGEDIYD